MYVPPLRTNDDQHALRAVLRYNQFPADLSLCNRTLVLFDDAITAGLGYSARLIALALLVAAQEKRVLVFGRHGRVARWCGRPPYTLNCYYEPITHCPYPPALDGPNASRSLGKWATRGSSFGLDGRIARSSAHVRISTSQIHRSIFWYKFHPPQALFAATHDILFRPRAWVREAARCIMRAAHLHGGNFAVIHARFSAEKKKERGATLPPLSEYLPTTQKTLERANASRVFLQTSTPEAVRLFESWCAERSWRLTFTRNERSTHDLWVTGSGKHSQNHTGERISVVAQAVNAHIASRSRHFVSPASSMWTWFVRALLGRRISDTLNDVAGEQYEECVSQLRRAHDGDGNATLGDIKRCKRTLHGLLLST
jgi:hypothetical protein